MYPFLISCWTYVDLIALTVIHIHVFLLTVTPKSADNYIAVYTGVGVFIVTASVAVIIVATLR
jgi:hypothetical protein